MGAQIGGSAISMGASTAGSIFGGPIGSSVGGMAGGLLGSFLFGKANKPLIPDYQLAAANYGHAIPIIYGLARLPGQMIWESNIKTVQHGLGLKGIGGGGPLGSTYAYLQSAAIAFCRGPAHVLKIWTDGRLFLDTTTGGEITKYPFTIRFYEGTETQMPDPTMVSWVLENVLGYACPGYRGLCYALFDSVDLTHFGNRFPNINALVVSEVVQTYNKVLVKPQAIPQGNNPLTDYTFNSGGVDWTKSRFYLMASDKSLRVFDAVTGTQLNGVAPWTGSLYPISGIAVSPAGYLYAYTSSNYVTGFPNPLGNLVYTGWTPQFIYKVDTTSLQPLIEIYVGFSNMLPNDNFVSMTVITVYPQNASPTDIAVGTWVLGLVTVIGVNGSASAFPVNLVMATTGLDAFTLIVPGKVDMTNGKSDIWVIQHNALFESGNLYISRVTFHPNGSFDQTEYTQLQSGNFGVPDPPDGFQMNVTATYDPADDTLVMCCPPLNKTIKWTDANNGVTIWTEDYTLGLDPLAQNTNGLTGMAGYTLLDLNSATTTSIPATDFNLFNASYGFSSLASAGAYSQVNEVPHVVFFVTQQGGAVPVGTILSELCQEAGLSADQIDVTLVTAATLGYTRADAKAINACITDLLHTYQLDMTESDWKLKFVPRGQPSVATIPQSDLASIDGTDASRFLVSKMAQEQEMPLQLNVRYVDPAMDYQPSAVYAKRIALPVPTQWSRRIKTVDLPVMANSQDARHIAETWLYTLWAERTTYNTILSPKYAYLDPTDTVTIDLDSGDVYELRIESTDWGADWTIKTELSSEDTTTYQPSTSPAVPYGNTPQVLVPAPFMDMLLINLPLLQDSDDLGGVSSRIYYFGAPNQALTGTPLAYVYKSTDAANWPQYATMTGFVSWGRAQNILGGTVSTFATDYVNTLQVLLAPGSASFPSCSYEDLMNGANAIVVGNEIIQAMTAQTAANGIVTLSGLVRGRRGTDWAINTHTAGEAVVMLQAGLVSVGSMALSELGVPEYWKLVPQGRTFDQTPTENYTHLGYDLYPYAPVQLARAPSGSDLVLSWVRRTRIGGLLQDGTDAVALNEETEAYEAYVLPGITAHRYWRLQGMNSQVQTGTVCIAELQLATSSAGGNLALGRAVTASSTTAPYVAGQAVDGNLYSYWEGTSGDTSATFMVDFGAGNAQAITYVTICPRFDAPQFTPGPFTVAWSDDGTTFVPAGSFVPSYWRPGVPQSFDLAAGIVANFNPGNVLTFVRSFTGLTAPTVTYTAAEMSADNFTPATQTLYLAVYQISAVVGRGFRGFAALPPY